MGSRNVLINTCEDCYSECGWTLFCQKDVPEKDVVWMSLCASYRRHGHEHTATPSQAPAFCAEFQMVLLLLSPKMILLKYNQRTCLIALSQSFSDELRSAVCLDVCQMER